MSLSIAQLIKQTVAALSTAGIDGAVRDARALVALATERRADRLTLDEHDTVTEAQQSQLKALVARRLAREPMSHILGTRHFFAHEFVVTRDTLDPRPETETLVLEALKGSFARVLDLGTGTGAILISLLAARPAAQGVASDVSEAALAVARQNAERIGVVDRVAFVKSDWLVEVRGVFDLIVSNPPYIALAEMPDLAPELAYEPRIALTDESDGLSAYRIIVMGAGAHLSTGGRLMVEIGWGQGAEVAALFVGAGFEQVEVLSDLDGRDRVVTGAKSE